MGNRLPPDHSPLTDYRSPTTGRRSPLSTRNLTDKLNQRDDFGSTTSHAGEREL